jgi:hypothetical protein
MSDLSDARRLNAQKIYLSVAGLFFVVFITIFTITILPRADVSLTYLLVFLLLLVTLVPIIIGGISKSLDIFELIYPIAALYFLYFGVRALYVLGFPEDMYIAYWGSPPVISFDAINLALYYTIIGFVFLLIGYYSFIPKIVYKLLPKLRLLRSSLRGSNIINKIYLIATIGIMSRLIMWSYDIGFFVPPAEGASLPFRGILFLLSAFSLFAYALCSIMLFSSPRIAKSVFILWSILLTLELGGAFLFGWKGTIIPLFVIPTIAYHYLRQRLPIRRLLPIAIVGLLVLIFVFFPVIPIYRVSVGEMGKPGSIEDFVAQMGIVYAKLSRYSWLEYLQISVRPFFNRMLGLDSFSMILRDTPNVVDFQAGRWYGYFFSAWIPRVLWEEKPMLDVGRWFAINFFNQPPDVPSAIVIMNIGDFYVNFGILGVMLGMFFLGIVYKTLYLYFIHYGKRSAIAVFIYIFIFIRLGIGIEADVISMFLSLLYSLLLVLSISWFLKMKLTARKYMML